METIRKYAPRALLLEKNQLLVLKLGLYLLSAFIFGTIFLGFPISGHSDQTVIRPDVTEMYVGHLVGSITKNQGQSKILAKHIVEEARKAGYDPLFIASIIKAESTFNPRARSNRGALGLMQLLPTTAKYISGKAEDVSWQGSQALTKPKYNIKLGLEYLRYLEGSFGENPEHVLIAYNWGPGNLKKALRNSSNIANGPQSYANKILDTYKSWKEKQFLSFAKERLA